MCIFFFFRAVSLQMRMSPFHTLDLSCAHCLCTSVYLSSVSLLLTCCWCLVWCETASWVKFCLTLSACSVHHVMGNYYAFVLYTVKMTDSCLCFCNRLAALNQLRMIVISALLLIIAVKCLLSWGEKTHVTQNNKNFPSDIQTTCQQFLTDLRVLRNCCSFRGRTQEANMAKQTRKVKTQHFKSNAISKLEICF